MIAKENENALDLHPGDRGRLNLIRSQSNFDYGLNSNSGTTGPSPGASVVAFKSRQGFLTSGFNR